MKSPRCRRRDGPISSCGFRRAPGWPTPADRGRARSWPRPGTRLPRKRVERARLRRRLDNHQRFCHRLVFTANTVCQIRTNRPPASASQPAPAIPARSSRGSRRATVEARALRDRVQIARLRPASDNARIAHAATRPGAGRPARRMRLPIAPGAKPSSSRISSADLDNPCAVAQQARARRDCGRSGRCPGTASTSRPWSSAQRAVMSDPLRSPASTTTTARESPLMIRLRSGKKCGSGGVPGASSLEDEHRSARSRAASAACSLRIDDVGAATRAPRSSRRRRQRAAMRRRVDAARQAADDDDAARSRDPRRAARPPRARTATPRASRRSPRPAAQNAAASPRDPETGGGSTIAASSGGYVGSLHGNRRDTGRAAPRAIAGAAREAAGRSDRHVRSGARRRARRGADRGAESRRAAGVAIVRRHQSGRSDSATRSVDAGIGAHLDAARPRQEKVGAAAHCGARPPTFSIRAHDGLRTLQPEFVSWLTPVAENRAFLESWPWHMACSYLRRQTRVKCLASAERDRYSGSIRIMNRSRRDPRAARFFGRPSRRPLHRRRAQRRQAQVDFGINVAQRGLWREAIYRWEKAVEIDPTYAAALQRSRHRLRARRAARQGAQGVREGARARTQQHSDSPELRSVQGNQ